MPKHSNPPDESDPAHYRGGRRRQRHIASESIDQRQLSTAERSRLWQAYVDDVREITELGREQIDQLATEATLLRKSEAQVASDVVDEFASDMLSKEMLDKAARSDLRTIETNLERMRADIGMWKLGRFMGWTAENVFRNTAPNQLRGPENGAKIEQSILATIHFAKVRIREQLQLLLSRINSRKASLIGRAEQWQEAMLADDSRQRFFASRTISVNLQTMRQNISHMTLFGDFEWSARGLFSRTLGLLHEPRSSSRSGPGAAIHVHASARQPPPYPGLDRPSHHEGGFQPSVSVPQHGSAQEGRLHTPSYTPLLGFTLTPHGTFAHLRNAQPSASSLPLIPSTPATLTTWARRRSAIYLNQTRADMQQSQLHLRLALTGMSGPTPL